MHQLQEYSPNLDKELLWRPEEVYNPKTAHLDLFFRFELNKLERPFQTVNGDIVWHIAQFKGLTMADQACTLKGMKI